MCRVYEAVTVVGQLWVLLLVKVQWSFECVNDVEHSTKIHKIVSDETALARVRYCLASSNSFVFFFFLLIVLLILIPASFLLGFFGWSRYFM